MKLEFYVNGLPVAVETPPLRSLLSILREDLGLRGTKEGCSEGECGACAVHLDGELVKSCMVPACQLWGRSVVTIEGVSIQGPTGLQDAFLEEGAVQCGFCTPGFVMASEYLLRNHPSPNEETIRKGLAGNLCRCTGYASLVRGVQRAVMGGYAPGRYPSPLLPPKSPGSLLRSTEKPSKRREYSSPYSGRGAQNTGKSGGGVSSRGGGNRHFTGYGQKGSEDPERVRAFGGLRSWRGWNTGKSPACWRSERGSPLPVSGSTLW